MARLVLFGAGYTGTRIAAAAGGDFDTVDLFGRDALPDAVRASLSRASHVVSTAPPADEGDPILGSYGDLIARVGWIGYLSSTGVYGDTGGAWTDEAAALTGRRGGR